MPDPHSHSNPEKVVVRHLALKLRADFKREVLHGSATLTVERTPEAREIILDTSKINIKTVEDDSGQTLDYDTGESDPVLGTPVRISLPASSDRIVIRYETSPEAEAVQWLSPAQTSGSHPFLFTQGQAILTRSWIPLQDTPGVRLTYEAQITVPDDLTALMSAERLGTPEADSSSGEHTFHFRLDRPVPSYLIALAIGDLHFAELGPRSGVFAEPAVIESAAYEFADTENMITAAEELYGPYLWGRFDILVLPPSFPFGGMENPCLTFATPTIIAGDRSQVSLVAHELAHSWSGNLVTNAAWDDLWLNEGFTVYFENRVMARLYGESHARMLRVLGWQDLEEDLRALPSEETRLNINLDGRNPDDGFSNIPYEKGALFLRTVEEQVGRESFDVFLREYFDRYQFESMSSERFLEHLEQELFADDDEGLARLRAQEWVYETGIPNNAQRPESEAFLKADEYRSAILADLSLSSDATGSWSTHEWLHFLRGMPKVLDHQTLSSLDSRFGFGSTGNNEILFEWLRICIRNQYEESFATLEDFLSRQGRRKFLKPLYEDLLATDWGKNLARNIYEKARPRYHAVSSRTIDELLEKAGP